MKRVFLQLNNYFILLVLLPLYLGQAANSSKVQVELEKANVEVELPKTWKTYKEILGIPLVLKGPTNRGQRPIIMITPTDVTGIKFNEEGLNKDQISYRKGRKKWVKKYAGKILDFFPYKMQSWENVERVHSVGMRYQLQDQIYEEYSYYLNCQDQFFHIKALFPLKKFQDKKQEILNIAKSFNCQRKI